MSQTSEIYTLPPDPRANACGAFFDALKAHRGKPLQIDAGAVDRIDTLVVQVLVLGAQTWAADDVPFSVENPTELLTTTLTKLGLEHVIFKEGTSHVA